MIRSQATSSGRQQHRSRPVLEGFGPGTCALVGEIGHRVARRKLMGGIPHPVDILTSYAGAGI